MKRRGAVGRWQCVWLGATVCASVCAEPRWPGESVTARPAEPASVAASDTEPPLRLNPPAAAIAWHARAALDLERPSQRQSVGLSIVELPAVGVPGARTRPRHALSVSSEYPKMMLRSIGVEATDCATRFRLPTKLRRDADGSGSSVELRADLGLACRF